MERYEIGDLILYGSTGVCRVADIQAHKGGRGEPERLYYTLEPLYQNCTIATPVDNDKIFMRPVITREEAEELIDEIPNIQAEAFHSTAMRELTQHYEAAIKTYDCNDLLELTLSIYAKKRDLETKKRKFGALDERFLHRAEELLFGELAAVLDLERDEVQEYITKRLDGKAQETRAGA